MQGVRAGRISITAPTVAERFSQTRITAYCAVGAVTQNQEEHSLNLLNARATTRLLPVSTGSPGTPRKGLPETVKSHIGRKGTGNIDRKASNAALHRIGKGA
jgi:hypothetical protein